MLFNSLTFLVFFACVFVVHQLLRNWVARKRWLLLASYVFYAAWYPAYVIILIFSTTLDWWLGLRISATTEPSRRRTLLIVSVAANLLLLGFFKYGGFVLSNIEEILSTFGVPGHMPAWNILLPIGISFYTFASLSYTIDVYRGEIDGRRSWLDYALFVSFFPHLVAGPIVRASQLLPQIEQPRVVTRDDVRWGLTLTIFGLFAKTVMADSVFAPIVEQVYAQPDAYSAVEVWAAVLGFSGQIYFDFSGYSLCAIGLALCFGYHFPDNFNYPYAARSFGEFWRRWHITLSTWLRDYLYIPLGGNRHGRLKTYRNLFLTMLLGGIWHGASWMFVLWGGLHGIYLALGRWRRQKERPDSVLASIHVFMIVTLTWIPFRAPDLTTAGQIVAGLIKTTPANHTGLPTILVYVAIAGTFIWQTAQRDRTLESRFAALAAPLKIAAITTSLFAIFLCSGGDERAFIYFQF